MIALPANLAEIESLVRNQVPESIHLDYKASPALDPKKRDEIAKDISAFANSDEDARSRRQALPLLIALDLGAPGGGLFQFSLENIGQAAALDVNFKWPKNMKWMKGTPPEQFVRGIKFLPPGKSLHIPYFGVFDLLKEKDTGDDPKFDIEVTYNHGETGQKLTETFHFEPADWRGTLIKQSDVEKQGHELCNHIRDLTRAVEKLSQQVDSLTPLASATGLQLSVATLKNLRLLLAGKSDIEKILAKDCKREVFQEVLGADISLAHRLQHHFGYGDGKKLEEVEGMTAELVATFRQYFIE
jgi:hypothetical protein